MSTLSPTARPKPGTLVDWHGRDWVVQPQQDPDVLELLPLGGHETERAGVFLPLLRAEERPQPKTFDPPGDGDLGDVGSALVLSDAARLALRTGGGPFRSFGKLSVRPRAYQLVPLLMALRQDPVRLLIADDVGVGKTVEGLMVVRELLDRGVVERFTVLCPPHLCDQWQTELREKFGIEAVVVRPDTAARLDREVQGDAGVFRYFPYQVVSIDYIKGGAKRGVFLSELPELVVVDEAHTCAKPPGATATQQRRHALLRDIAGREGQHLVMLTATPHSGKDEAFRSLVGLLDPRFETADLSQQTERRRLARHFVQRRRGDIEAWIEDTPFPKRTAVDVSYPLHPDYLDLFHDLREFARGFVVRDGEGTPQQRMRYWTVLGLLRGVLSSPKAGALMLRNRAGRLGDDDPVEGDDPADDVAEAAEEAVTTSLFDEREHDDTEPAQAPSFAQSEVRKLEAFAQRLDALADLDHDRKARAAVETLAGWLDAGRKPIVFCRFIGTAEHFGALAEPALRKRFPELALAVVTGQDDADRRSERVEDLAEQSERRVLVATDCLSEGINLQEHFDAVLHYDLPWNPNRLEQREGRVDRFGQARKTVDTALLVGEDNPIDGVVLNVLLKKAREIKRLTGVTVPLSEDSKSVMDAVLSAVILNPSAGLPQASTQLSLDLDAERVRQQESAVGKAMDEGLSRSRETHSIYAQNALRPEDIEPDLRETDAALGSPETVERFVRRACARLGVQLEPVKAPRGAIEGFTGYRMLTLDALPPPVRAQLPSGSSHKVTFKAPTPDGFVYLGRTHPFVEALSGWLLRAAFDADERLRPARAAVIRTGSVESGTTLVVLRVRTVIEAARGPQFVAEEVIPWGYRGLLDDGDLLAADEAAALLDAAQPQGALSDAEARYFLADALAELADARDTFDDVTRERTQALVDAHERYRGAVGGGSYTGVEPVLPPDVLGVYVLLPTQS